MFANWFIVLITLFLFVSLVLFTPVLSTIDTCNPDTLLNSWSTNSLALLFMLLSGSLISILFDVSINNVISLVLVTWRVFFILASYIKLESSSLIIFLVISVF